MNHSEFRAFALALYGPEWQSPLARALGVADRTVRRWASEESPLPPWLAEELRKLAGGVKPAGLIADEWLLADGAQGRRYVVHTMPPRLLWLVDGGQLATIFWIDRAVTGSRLEELKTAALARLSRS